MDDAEVHDLIGHLFALITARLEDAVTLAVNGQAIDQSPNLIANLRGEIEDARSLLGAVETLQCRRITSSVR